MKNLIFITRKMFQKKQQEKRIVEKYGIIFLFFLLILFYYQISFSQTPDWIWAKSAGGTSSDYGESCSTDSYGNIIATGYFNSAIITFGSTTLTNTGNSDFFIVKYDPSGNVLWAKSAGGSGGDFGKSCTIDANGNIIVTGYFNSAIITFDSTTLTNNGSSDFFIVKYDPNGNVLWAKSAGGSDGDYGTSVIVDKNRNIIVTGYFNSSNIFFEMTNLANNGSIGTSDIFLVKYDENGIIFWAKTAGGINSDEGSSIATDSDGNILLTGYFQNSSIIFETITLTNVGSKDIFLVKYDTLGNVLWADKAGGTNNDWANSVAIDGNGNVFVTGSYTSSSLTFGSTTLSSADTFYEDIFIVKYNANGNVLWAESAGGDYYDVCNSITTDIGGNVFITGFFGSHSLTFGTTTLMAAPGFGKLFIVKYDGSGNTLWAKSEGGVYCCGVLGFDDRGNNIVIDYEGNAFVTGSFETPIITFGSTSLSNGGGVGSTKDMYIAKFSNCIPINFSHNLDICNGQSITIGSNIYNSNGTYTDTLNTSGGCDSIVTTNLTVLPLLSVSIDSIPNFININTPPLSLDGNPSGGTFTGPGVSGNNFNPSVAGLGKKEITYSYTDTNSCSNSATISTIVYDTSGVLCTSYDTVTTTLIINDTVITNITDTTFISVTDTNFVTVIDTNLVTVNDTVFISVIDTNFVTVTDTNLVTLNDTIFISVTDTTYLTINDTNYTYISVTDTLIINAILTGVNPPNNTNTLKIYPNPTSTHLIIDNGNFNSMSNYQIKIENTLGQKVFESLLTQPQFTLDLSSWSGKGIYFLYIYDGTESLIAVRKIVLQ